MRRFSADALRGASAGLPFSRMCGIAGAFGHLDETVRDALRRASAALHHRGPDADGQFEWSSEGRGVLLLHRRLSILDLSAAGNQPMRGPDGSVICYNGEVYNFQAMRDGLRAAGHVFHSGTDTEVLLAAHREQGDAAPEKFRGMFAYALWQPDRRELLLTRDHFGMKPLYVARVRIAGGETLVFASELRALLATGLVPRRLDRIGVDSYLWNGFVIGPSTIVEGVELLPPGSSLRVRLEDLRGTATTWWRVPVPVPAKDGRERLKAALADSVDKHLIADVPVGVFLSGGVDSSAVASLAKRVTDDVRTFVLGFDEGEFDESRHAAEVARLLGTRHEQVRLTQQEFVAELDHALASIDQPTFDGVNTWFVSRAARAAGVTVALAGTGGDELFGGYSSFDNVTTMARRVARLRWLPPGGRATVGRLLRPLLAPTTAAVGQQVRFGKLPETLAYGEDVLAGYQTQYALFRRDFLSRLRPGYSLFDSFGVPPLELEELLALRSVGGRAAVSNLELRMFLGQRLLRDTDAASMDSSLEVRLPLVDREVLDAALALPPEQRFTEPKKLVLRELAMPQLPAALFDRKKTGFTLPFDRWCRDALRSEIDSTLRDAAQCRRVGIEPGAVAGLWQSFLSGARGIYWSRVWSIYALIRWCRDHDVRVATA